MEYLGKEPHKKQEPFQNIVAIFKINSIDLSF